MHLFDPTYAERLEFYIASGDRSLLYSEIQPDRQKFPNYERLDFRLNEHVKINIFMGTKLPRVVDWRTLGVWKYIRLCVYVDGIYCQDPDMCVKFFRCLLKAFDERAISGMKRLNAEDDLIVENMKDKLQELEENYKIKDYTPEIAWSKGGADYYEPSDQIITDENKQRKVYQILNS